MQTTMCIVRRVLPQQLRGVCIRNRLPVRADTAHVRLQTQIVKKRANHGLMQIQATTVAADRNARAHPAAEAALDGMNRVQLERNIATRIVNLVLSPASTKLSGHPAAVR